VTDIFREVDEEIRKERYEALWKKYGPYVIGLAVVIVLSVAGYQAWTAYQRDQALEDSNAFAAANQQFYDGEHGAAVESLAKLADPDAGGYGLLAAFRRADILAIDGKEAAAIEIWQRIAEQAPQEYFRTLAELFVVMHRFDEADPAELDSRLAAIAESDSPFRTTALELQALLAVKQGDEARAAELYKEIADGANIPPQQRQRATELLARLEG